MTIDDIIAKLQTLRVPHGNIEVLIRYNDDKTVVPCADVELNPGTGDSYVVTIVAKDEA